MKWISVKDKLPESYKDVIVSHDGIVGVAYTRHNGTWINGNNYGIKVTHWMPLPSPPDSSPN